MGDSDIDHDSVNERTMVVGVPSTKHRKKSIGGYESLTKT